MNTDNTKCPNCSNDINADDIKCNNCGCALKNDTLTNEIPIPEEQIIEPQNFIGAIVIAVLSLLFSFAELFSDNFETVKPIITALSLLASIYVMYFFKNYLKNFKANKAIKLVNWVIILTMIMGIHGLLYSIYKINYSTVGDINNEPLITAASLILFVSVVIYFILNILLGTALIRIKNDFVGNIKLLGYVYIFYIILLVVANILFFIFSIPLSGYTSIILSNLPTFVLILIFYRAHKFVNAE